MGNKCRMTFFWLIVTPTTSIYLNIDVFFSTCRCFPLNCIFLILMSYNDVSMLYNISIDRYYRNRKILMSKDPWFSAKHRFFLNINECRSSLLYGTNIDISIFCRSGCLLPLILWTAGPIMMGLSLAITSMWAAIRSNLC